MELFLNHENKVENVSSYYNEIFKHCTGGLAAITEEDFDTRVKQILELHNIKPVCDWR